MSIGWSEFFEKPPKVLVIVCACAGAAVSPQSAMEATANSGACRGRIKVMLILAPFP
jgi:hypothetical protein